MTVASNFVIEIPMFGGCMAKSSCAIFSTYEKQNQLDLMHGIRPAL